MASNLKAWLERATPLSRSRAKELVDADMAANARRYPAAAATSEAMDSEYGPTEAPGGPAMHTRILSVAVKATFEVQVAPRGTGAPGTGSEIEGPIQQLPQTTRIATPSQTRPVSPMRPDSDSSDDEQKYEP